MIIHPFLYPQIYDSTVGKAGKEFGPLSDEMEAKLRQVCLINKHRLRHGICFIIIKFLYLKHLLTCNVGPFLFLITFHSMYLCIMLGLVRKIIICACVHCTVKFFCARVHFCSHYVQVYILVHTMDKCTV